MGAKISSWIFFNITGETNKIGFGMLPGVTDFLSELNSLHSGHGGGRDYWIMDHSVPDKTGEVHEQFP